VIDGLLKESEIVVDNGLVQRSRATFLQTACPLDFHVNHALTDASNVDSYLHFEVWATLFEMDRPGYTERRAIDLGCVGPDSRQTERNPTHSQALLGVRRLQRVARSSHLDPFREDILLRWAKTAPVSVGLHAGQNPFGALLDSGTGDAIVFSSCALGHEVHLNSGDSQLKSFLFGHVLKVVVINVDRQFPALSEDWRIHMVVRWVGCVRRHREYVESEVKYKNWAEM
jgi:hypothetical protein